MNKEITIYELLGLIKDDKAPRKIKYDKLIWIFEKQFGDYIFNGRYLIAQGFHNWESTINYLNEEVEIIEEDKPIIEKVEFIDNFTDSYYDTCLIKLGDKLNEVIDYINKKEEDGRN